MRRTALLLWIACSLLPLAAGAREGADPITRLESPQNLLEDPSARVGDDRIHVVVEIPAGTDAKWEVTPDGDAVAWERQDGALRVVRYLPYPGDYGMVPRTLQDPADGGDGDALDVLILGPARARGSVVEARPIGMLRLLDDGERDDKILAVLEGTPLGELRDLGELQERFPGVLEIVETWFAHYKGPGRIEVRGREGRDAAWKAIDAAAAAYEKAKGD